MTSADTRTRVLRIIGRANVGGPARQVVVLARHLDPHQFDQRLLVGYVAPDEADYLAVAANDLDVTRVAGLGRAVRPLDDLRALRRIIQEIRSFRPHVVHTHTAKAGVLGRVAAIICRVPVRVHTFHGHLLHGYFSRTMTCAVTTAERVLASQTSALVAVGDRVRDELLQASVGRREQWTVIPPGIDIAPLPERAGARKVLDIANDVPVISLIGRLVRVKRPDRFAAAATLVRAAVPDAVFLIVGDGPERKDLETLTAREDSIGWVRFLGWRSDIETVLAASDVVVLTSDNEGMPVSLIEAGLAARATVTTDVGSAAEVVLDGRTGRVVAKSANAIAAAVIELIDDPVQRAQLGAAARVHAESRFGVHRLAADTEALYERLLDVRRHR